MKLLGEATGRLSPLETVRPAFFQRNCISDLDDCSLEVARDALHEISTHVQDQVIASLKEHWQQDASIDFIALQDVVDSSQDRAILTLLQLQQRMITLGPVENFAPAPLNISSIINNIGDSSQHLDLTTPKISSSIVISSKGSSGAPHARTKSISSNSSTIRPITPPDDTFGIPCSAPLESSLSQMSTDTASHARKESSQYKPMATTVTTTGFFGIGKRTKIEPVVSPPENPLVDEYLADAMEGAAKDTSRWTSISTTDTSLYEPEHPPFNSWQDYRTQSPTMSHKPTPSILSFESVRRYPSYNREVLTSNRSLAEIRPEDLLPSEMNDYAGFCKGAWRQQIGDKKRAMEERVRPGGMYNAAKYWQCKHCKFEGRLTPINKKLNGYDMRIFRLVEGIQFRWEFMFKSHIPTKDQDANPTKATFGCMFCCADGRPMPSFSGVQAFMSHLTEHRDPLPTGEVLYRLNCLVGRQAAPEEDFDINIVARESLI